MMTFLPLPDFKKSAESFDYRRLGKQRIEVLWLLKTIIKGDLKRHPLIVMWENHIDALVHYGLEICNEWVSRGYQDNCAEKIKKYKTGNKETVPKWLGMEILHSSHRGNLIRKQASWYSSIMGWQDSPLLPYYWPGKG